MNKNNEHGQDRASEDVLEQIAIRDVQDSLQKEMKLGLAKHLSNAIPDFKGAMRFLMKLTHDIFNKN